MNTLQLATMRQGVVTLRTMLGTPSSWTHTKQDLGDKSKWTFGDLETFGKLLKSLVKDVATAYEVKNELVPVMREIESNLLKGNNVHNHSPSTDSE